MALRTIDIVIKDSCGAYVTSTVKTKRASSTNSAHAAAEKLGRKIWGDGFHEAVQIDKNGAGVSRWRLHGDDLVP